MNHHVHQVFPQAEDDIVSISSNEQPLPDEVPPQLADTPGPFLKSLGLPPRPQASSWSDRTRPRPSARAEGGANKELKSTVPTPEVEKSNKAVALTKRRKKKTPAADPKKWVPLAFREKKRDDFIYYDTDRLDIED